MNGVSCPVGKKVFAAGSNTDMNLQQCDMNLQLCVIALEFGPAKRNKCQNSLIGQFGISVCVYEVSRKCSQSGRSYVRSI